MCKFDVTKGMKFTKIVNLIVIDVPIIKFKIYLLQNYKSGLVISWTNGMEVRFQTVKFWNGWRFELEKINERSNLERPNLRVTKIGNEKLRKLIYMKGQIRELAKLRVVRNIEWIDNSKIANFRSRILVLKI